MLNDTQETTDTSETTVPEETAAETSTTEGETKAKTEETPEARHARLKRQLDQHEKKHKLGSYAEKQPEGDGKQASKQGDFDYGELAYLTAKGIEADEDIALVRQVMSETGKALKDVLGSKYFQAELKQLREDRAAKDAIPAKNGRTGGAARDTVDYWIAKGELPPDTPENKQLRRDVVNAKAKAQTSGTKFSSNAIIG